MSTLLSGIYLGQSVQITRIFTEDDVQRCAELTGDFNPMYFNHDFVQDTRFKRPIVQALLTEGVITSMISNFLPGGGCVLLQKELFFIAPVYIGDLITINLEVIDIDQTRNWVIEKVICKNQYNQEVIRGQLVLLVEKRVTG